MLRSSPTRPARARRNAYRPHLDGLERRQLLSAGDLDTSFNSPNGYVLTGFTAKGNQGSSGLSHAVAIQKITQGTGTTEMVVAAGEAFNDFALARYRPEGSLDTGFGSGGKVR